MTDPPKPHSADFLTDHRDLWWSSDYLDLLARRHRTTEIGSLVDVGCGLGHWGRRWYPRLAPGAWLVRGAPAPRGVGGASERLARPFPDGRAAFVRGAGCRLPFADGAFDAATCQTLLIHLDEPERAVAEMARVVRPGGLVLCSEPNLALNC